MLFIVLGVISTYLGIKFILNSKKETFDITKIKGKRKQNESDKEFEIRMRKKAFRSGICITIYGVFVLIWTFFIAKPV